MRPVSAMTRSAPAVIDGVVGEIRAEGANAPGGEWLHALCSAGHRERSAAPARSSRAVSAPSPDEAPVTRAILESGATGISLLSGRR
jgi:hypothetical protein